jgi:hypothetical protein
MPVCGSGVLVSSSCLLIRRAQRARCQAETPPILLFRFPEPALLRHIRVASKQELKERIMAGIEDINRHPVIHTWSYKLAEAA